MRYAFDIDIYMQQKYALATRHISGLMRNRRLQDGTIANNTKHPLDDGLLLHFCYFSPFSMN